jgi:hypothetical protein
MDVTISRVVHSTVFFKTFADMMGIDLNFFVYRQPPMDTKEKVHVQYMMSYTS